MLISNEIWDIETGTKVFDFNDHYNSLQKMVFSPDGRYILVMGSDAANEDYEIQKAELWDIFTAKVVAEYRKYSGIVTSAAFSNDGQKVVINTNRYRIIAESMTGKIICSDSSFYGSEQGWIFSPDGKYYARIDNTTENKLSLFINPEDDDLPKESKQQSGPRNKHLPTISIHETGSGKVVKYLEGTSGKFVSVSYSKDGKYLVTSHSDNSIKIWDTTSGRMIKSMEDHSSAFSSPVLFADSSHLCTFMKDGATKIWNLYNGKTDISFNSNRPEIIRNIISNNNKYVFTITNNCTVEIRELRAGRLLRTLNYSCMNDFALNSPDGKYLVINQQDSTSVIDIEGGRIINQTAGNVICAAFSPDSKYIFISKNNNTSSIIEAGTGLTKNEINIPDHPVTLALYSNFGNYILLQEAEDMETGMSKTYVYDYSRSKIICELQDLSGYRVNAFFSADNKYIIGGSEGETKKVWEIKSGKVKYEFENSEYSRFPFIQSKDGTFFILSGNEFPAAFDSKSFSRIYDLTDTEFLAFAVSFSPDQQYILTSHFDNTARLWESASGRLVHSLEGHSDELINADFSPDGKHIVTSSKDHTIKLWDTSSGKEIATLIPVDSSDWMIVTPDMYYFASKGALTNMAWKSGTRIFSFEQFDLQYNRPDIVLERIGIADSNLIDAYRKAYYKRLKKMNVDEGMLSPEFHTPDIEIINRENLPYMTNKSKFQADVNAKDSKFKIKQLHVRVNEVPVFGMDGLDISTLKSDSVVQTINLELSPGINKITVSCLNETGVESLKETTEILYEPPKKVKPDLYIIALSCDRFQQSQFNLSYAVNDGKSLAELFASGNDQYATIFVDTIFNEHTTLENVLKLKEKLLK
ncbi:MAG: hypothetical protein KJ607_00150, partial [Bacteroidetes bacterium]|nr:hypothetical protein [Bacteroidota bacterium]